MIVCTFYLGQDHQFAAFRVQGHAGYADAGQDIVCAGVSSAVMLTANLLADAFGKQGDYQSYDDTVFCKPAQTDDLSHRLIQGLYEHLTQLAADYPSYLKVQTTKLSEV